MLLAYRFGEAPALMISCHMLIELSLGESLRQPGSTLIHVCAPSVSRCWSEQHRGTTNT